MLWILAKSPPLKGWMKGRKRMIKEVDLSKTIEKKDYESIMPNLKLKLAELQRKAKDLNIPINIVFEGWGASGKGTFINEIILPLDPRGFNVYTTNSLNEEERLRPFLWRFWIKTPERGRIAIFDKSWYRRALVERIDSKIEGQVLLKTFDDINSFEKQLVDDGNVIIKFYLHINKKEQQKRFRKLEKNPATAWKVTEADWKHNEQYDKYLYVIDEMFENTDKDYAPWTIIEAEDKRFAVVKIFKTIINSIEDRIDKMNCKNISIINEKSREAESVNSTVLEKIDLKKTLSFDEYNEKLKIYQKKLRDIEYEIYTRRIPVVILYEGWDAAGKGGNIKRITKNLDPRGYQVVPVAAPNDIEKAHHYLWRFWKEIPKAGHITIFDRSWYGRLLVEKVEGYCTPQEGERSYSEINDMEEQLSNFGVVVVKFWLHIDKEEQLTRFNQRKDDPEKQWKITDDDWRNREKWDKYEDAANEMIVRTSTTYAPWTIVESNSKYYARIKTLKTIIDALEKKL